MTPSGRRFRQLQMLIIKSSFPTTQVTHKRSEPSNNKYGMNGNFAEVRLSVGTKVKP